MIDPELKSKVDLLVKHVQEINKLMCHLQENKVEVRLSFKLEENPEKKPLLSIFRCAGRDDYLD